MWFAWGLVLGGVTSTNLLGMLCVNGIGATHDPRRAGILLKKAASKDVGNAMQNLFVLYSRRPGVAKDPGKEAQWPAGAASDARRRLKLDVD